MQYVPAEYRPLVVGDSTFWSADGRVQPLADVVVQARVRIEALLGHRLRRALHVVRYASNAEARTALARDVSPTMLLAPLHRDDLALIAVQDLAPDPRHVCHELGHVFVAERTGSVKELGDGSVGMRIPAWADEGFAECLAALAADRPDVIERARARTASGLTDEDLTRAFRDLSSPQRPLAFAVATLRMWEAVATRGIAAVFATLGS
jgi:hypothetical protein